jgi:LacI family transcriptional regulator
VQDVVKAAAISRRRLQEKFYDVLGRTISDEIARVRTEQISQMLINTDMTVKQIALKFGYNGLSHISRFFKRQTGFPPVEYRKKYGRV